MEPFFCGMFTTFAICEAISGKWSAAFALAAWAALFGIAWAIK